MAGLLVTTSEGGNYNLALADGGQLFVQNIPGGAAGLVSAVTASLPITSSGGATPVIGLEAGATVAVTVATGTALTAFATTGLLTGAVAYIQSRTTYWSYQPTDPGPADGYHLAAAGGGFWVYVDAGSPQAAQKQTAWFIDPLNTSTTASEDNSGLTALLPLATIAEVQRRMGTETPLLSTAVAITWLSNGPTSDPFLLTPDYVPTGSLALQGTTTTTTTTTIGIFTPANRAAGTLATLTAVGVAAWTNGQRIYDTTTACSFVVVSSSGATATISNPVARLVATPAPVTPVSGDTIQLVTLTTVAAPRLTATTAFPTAKQIAFTTPNALMLVNQWLFFECSLPVTIGAHNIEGRNGSSFYNCYVANFAGAGFFQAGAIVAGLSFLTGALILDGDVAFLGAFGLPAGVNVTLGAVYLTTGSSPMTQSNTYRTTASPAYGPGGRPVVWGPHTINMTHGAQLNIQGGTAVQVMLGTGGLQLDGAATGFTFNAGTGAFSAGAVALTPAALDANASFQNPSTGSRMFIN